MLGGRSKPICHQNAAKVLLWINGSLSLLTFLGCRVVTQGAWMQMKKPAWAGMPVLDMHILSDAQVASLATAYDALCDRELLALARLNVDPARRAMDEALSTALGLPDLSPLREMLAREPGLMGKSAVGQPTGKQAALLDSPEKEDGDQGEFF